MERQKADTLKLLPNISSLRCGNSPMYIVSLTSYGERLNVTAPYAIITLFNQSVQPDKIVLWVSHDDRVHIPPILKELEAKGLEIRFCDDIGVYKRLIYPLIDFPDNFIITADDDLYYPHDWLEKMIVMHQKHPNKIICHRGHSIRVDENYNLLPIEQWDRFIDGKDYFTTDGTPVAGKDIYSLYSTVGSGQLFPPRCLYHEVTNIELALKLCPMADGVWFWAMTILNTEYFGDEPPYIFVQNGFQCLSSDEVDLSFTRANGRLTHYNTKGGNDIQLRSIIKHYPQISEYLKKITPYRREKYSNMREKAKTSSGYKQMDFTDIEFFDIETLMKVESKLVGLIEGTEHRKNEMKAKERAFLNGIIRKAKPKTIVEIGASAGGSTCVILNAISDIEGAHLYSFDYNTIWYRDLKTEIVNPRKTAFLVEEILPEMLSKWTLQTGGVPCKYFDCLPADGVDICFIDTAHSNPGEHLNILEILPFMKTNGIIIYHDVNYHILKPNHYTCLTSSNTLNGKRIILRSEKTQGIPNIIATILDDNVDDMLYPLFSNLSLNWKYLITKEDFNDMLLHFQRHYSPDLVKFYVFFYIYFVNGGSKNKKEAKSRAEETTMRYINAQKRKDN